MDQNEILTRALSCLAGAVIDDSLRYGSKRLNEILKFWLADTRTRGKTAFIQHDIGIFVDRALRTAGNERGKHALRQILEIGVLNFHPGKDLD